MDSCTVSHVSNGLLETAAEADTLSIIGPYPGFPLVATPHPPKPYLGNTDRIVWHIYCVLYNNKKIKTKENLIPRQQSSSLGIYA